MLNNKHSIREVEQEFRDFMTSAGITLRSDVICLDGQVHRFHIEGDRLGSKNGWYIVSATPRPIGVFGSWKDGSKHIWRGFDGKSNPLSTREFNKLQAQIRKAAKDRAIEISLLQCGVANMCTEQWPNMAYSGSNHPYLIRKNVQANGIKQRKSSLLVPLRDVKGNLCSWQSIHADGQKRFIKGGRIKGCFHTLGVIAPKTTTIFIAEGYATAATVYENMSDFMDRFIDTAMLPDRHDYAVITAFNASNMPHVAHSIREAFKTNPIVIVADNDHHTDTNPGVTYARQAKAECNACQLVIPDFEPTDTSTDFNDFYNNLKDV